MKHKKTIVVPAYEKVQVVKVTCDLCGQVIQQKGYDVDEVTVSRRTGYSCPESHSVTELTVDLCGKCFDTKLRPWLVSQGAVACEEEHEW